MEGHSLKFLILSDVHSWDRFKEIFEKVKPDYLLLAGDLTSDGGARFWTELYLIEGFTEEIKKLSNRYEELLRPFYRDFNRRKQRIELITPEYDDLDKKKKAVLESSDRICSILRNDSEKNETISNLYWRYSKDLSRLKEKYRHSSRFYDLVRSRHVEKFYQALKFAGKRSTRVFVVKGDHDIYDFPETYDVDQINHTANCVEISGKKVAINNWTLLGPGYAETHYLRTLRPMIATTKADIILIHSEQKRLMLISQMKPKIIFRGHFGFGKSTISDSVLIETGVFPKNYVVADINGKKVSIILQNGIGHRTFHFKLH